MSTLEQIEQILRRLNHAKSYLQEILDVPRALCMDDHHGHLRNALRATDIALAALEGRSHDRRLAGLAGTTLQGPREPPKDSKGQKTLELLEQLMDDLERAKALLLEVRDGGPRRALRATSEALILLRQQHQLAKEYEQHQIAMDREETQAPDERGQA
jgi:hypothetical protein